MEWYSIPYQRGPQDMCNILIQRGIFPKRRGTQNTSIIPVEREKIHKREVHTNRQYSYREEKYCMTEENAEQKTLITPLER